MAAFVADYLSHMALEEHQVMPALAAASTFDELLAVQIGVRTTALADKVVLFMRWVLPAANPDERVAMLGGLKRTYRRRHSRSSGRRQPTFSRRPTWPTSPDASATEPRQDLTTAHGRPGLFGQRFDGPMPGHSPGMPIHFDLHAWVWEANPTGILSAWNPAVSCP